MKMEDELKIEQLRQAVDKMDIAQVTAYYRKVQERRKQIDERLDVAKAMQKVLETRMENYLLETNQDGTITPNGTIKRVLKDTFYVEDKPAFRDWAIQQGREELMTISVTQKAMNAYHDEMYQNHLKAQAEAEKKGETLPPFVFTMPSGITKKQEYKLSITK